MLRYYLVNGEVLVQFQVRFACMLISFSLLCATSLACPQRGSIPSDFQTTVTQPVKLKASRMPSASYPREALKKGIEGTIVLSIVVNAEGKVSEAKVRSGPPELAQAALESAKLWEFEPPASAPITETVSISYGIQKDCPGPVSDTGIVTVGSRFTGDKGNVIGMDDSVPQHLPPYPADQRKAGASGRMQLSITVDPHGAVTQASVVISLSPQLDNATLQTVRGWKFQLISGDWQTFPDVFALPIQFQPSCSPRIN